MTAPIAVPTTAGQPHDTRRNRRVARLLAAGVATPAAVAVWLVIEFVFGLDLRSPAFGTQPSQDVGAGNVAFAATLASLGGWALLVTLERFTSRALQAWTVIASVVLVVSLSTPFSGTGITTANRMGLALLHLTVGAVLIAVLRRTGARSGHHGAAAFEEYAQAS